MEFTNDISLDTNSIQKEQIKISIRMLSIFLGASLLFVGFLTTVQTTSTNHKTCQCPQEKHCRCGNNCSCGSSCGCF